MSGSGELNNNDKESDMILHSLISSIDESVIASHLCGDGDKEVDVNCACVGATKEKDKAKDLYPLLQQTKVCFMCTEKDVPTGINVTDADCKICNNIRLYHSKNDVPQKGKGLEGIEDNDDEIVDISFPGPGIVKRNHIYGHYVVASRVIKPGELIISEKPICIGPYSPPDILPLCLSCSKDIGLSTKCSKCKWPVCGKECEEFYLHSTNECSIFAKLGIKCKDELNEYFSVEALRVLLLKRTNPKAWKRILEFEPHIEARSNDYKAKATTDFIVDFLRNKCQLADEFSTEVIDHVVGVLSVNTFWAFKDLKRYASCLFDKITLLAHDCDPNTSRRLVYQVDTTDNHEEITVPKIKDPELISTIALEITAARRILPGEMLSIRYINLDQPVSKRREELLETFYFTCTCSRCLREISEDAIQLERHFTEVALVQ